MKRALILASALFALACSADAGWQSRDSNYNKSISIAPPSFTGTGDVVSGFNAWWSPGIGYNAAYAASGTNPAADVCDAGGTNCITLNVGTNGLVAAPGATACGGSTCISISKLYDQSGANYCAGPCHLTQSTNAVRPLLLTNCGGGTMLCASFTSTGLVLNGPTLPSIAQPYTISGVIKKTSALISEQEILTTPCGQLYGTTNDGISSPTFELYANSHASNNTTILSNGTTYALTGVYNDTSSISSVNATQTTVTPGNNAWTGGATALGFAGCFTGTKFEGTVSEIGIKGAAFTGTQITNVTAQQRSNWGF